MTKKLFIYLMATFFLTTVSFANAQQLKKVPRIGFLWPGSYSSVASHLEAFQQGLRELGYNEGQSITIEYRLAEGKYDRLPDLAAELAHLNVDVIVAPVTTTARAAKQATTSIPIVMVRPSDPVGSGLIASLARPGGNITGLSEMNPELSGKRLELVKEVIPGISRVAVLWNPANPAMTLQLKETEVAARSLSVSIRVLDVRGPNELDNVFSSMTADRVGAFIVMPDAMLTDNRKRIVDLAAKNRLPAMYVPEFVDAGGLMAYGPSFPDLYRRAATYVDKILRGTKPADLPVERPTKFELVINVKAAKQIGLTIPPNVLVRADKVIK
jgi:putative ABC transport system substrate-binding protein